MSPPAGPHDRAGAGAPSATDGTRPPSRLIHRLARSRPGTFLRRLPWRVIVPVGAVALTGMVLAGATDLVDAQRADALGLARTVRDASGRLDIPELRIAVLVDMAFACSYAVLVSWLILRLRSLNSRSGRVRGRQHDRAAVGVAAVFGAAAADIGENALLLAQLARMDRTALESHLAAGAQPPSRALEASGIDGFGDSLLEAMRAAGVVKWALLTVTVLVVADMWLRRRAAATGFEEHASTDRPPPTVIADWSPPREGGRKGVCLSGGGIRSASFSLGVMQALSRDGRLDDVDYLAAVSGGGYLAAGWSVSNGRVDGPPALDPAPWSPGSPEERWFRSHSSYLIPNLWRGIQGIARLLVGIAVNLALVWAVLFVGARPIGWIIHEVHPEMRPAKPLTLPLDLQSGFALSTVLELDPIERTVDGVPTEVRRFRVDIEPVRDPGVGDAHDNDVCFEVAPFTEDPSEVCYQINQQEAGIVELREDVIVVTRDPVVKAAVSTCDDELDSRQAAPTAEEVARCRNVKRLLTVAGQPDLKADDRPVGQVPEIDTTTSIGAVGVIADRLTLEPAVVDRVDGPATRGERAFDPWMWWGVFGLLGFGAAIGLAAMFSRSTGVGEAVSATRRRR